MSIHLSILYLLDVPEGVIWVGNRPMKKSQDLVKKIRGAGKRVFFITNNSTKTREEFLAKFNKLGYEATIVRTLTCVLTLPFV